MNKKLIIISNERFSKNGGDFYCDNLAEKSVPDDLNEYFDIKIIGRYANTDRSHKLKTSQITRLKNFFSYLIEVFKNTKGDEKTFLALSISFILHQGKV